MIGHEIPQRPLLAGLEPRHFAHPVDVSARRRMDRLVAGKPRMGKAGSMPWVGRVVFRMGSLSRCDQRASCISDDVAVEVTYVTSFRLSAG